MLKFRPAPRKHFAEISQTFPMLFAWVRREGDEYIAQHSWIKCRDFLADAVLLHMRKDYKSTVYSYGIDKDYKPEPILALKFPNLGYKSNFYNNLGRIRQIENINNISHPIRVVFDEGEILVVEFDPFWMKHPSLISLYTFLLKIFSYRVDNHFDAAPATEAQYIMSTGDCLEKLLANLGKLTYGKFDNGMALYSFHDNVGFVSTFKKSSKHELREQLMRI